MQDLLDHLFVEVLGLLRVLGILGFLRVFGTAVPRVPINHLLAPAEVLEQRLVLDQKLLIEEPFELALLGNLAQLL